MSLFVLDTDILSLFYRGEPIVVRIGRPESGVQYVTTSYNRSAGR
jgi:hypothetical protein